MEQISHFCLGHISSKYLILDILVIAFDYDDCILWLWSLSKKSRAYLNENIKYLINRKIPKIKSLNINNYKDF